MHVQRLRSIIIQGRKSVVGHYWPCRPLFEWPKQSKPAGPRYCGPGRLAGATWTNSERGNKPRGSCSSRGILYQLSTDGLWLCRVPRAAHVVDTQLLSTRRPLGCLTEPACKWPRSRIVASELVIDSRETCTGGAPAPIGLHVRSWGNHQGNWLSIGSMVVVAMPIGHLSATQRSHVGWLCVRLGCSDRET